MKLIPALCAAVLTMTALAGPNDSFHGFPPVATSGEPDSLPEGFGARVETMADVAAKIHDSTIAPSASAVVRKHGLMHRRSIPKGM
jgi:hypothetical protein